MRWPSSWRRRWSVCPAAGAVLQYYQLWNTQLFVVLRIMFQKPASMVVWGPRVDKMQLTHICEGTISAEQYCFWSNMCRHPDDVFFFQFSDTTPNHILLELQQKGSGVRVQVLNWSGCGPDLWKHYEAKRDRKGQNCWAAGRKEKKNVIFKTESMVNRWYSSKHHVSCSWLCNQGGEQIRARCKGHCSL